MADYERLSGWDYATWHSASEDQSMRSTMVGLTVLDRAPDWDRLVDRFDRASRNIPILRKKMVEGPIGIANPRLVIDPDFDLHFHLRRFRMTDGSTWQDVLDEARRQSMTDFDRDRPLWRITVLEGLPGGRSVILSKLHHAIADGQGAMQIGAATADLTREGDDQGPMPPAPNPVTLTPRHFAEIMIQDNSEWVLHQAKSLAKNALPRLVSFVTDPAAAVDQITSTVASIARMANTPTSPMSPIMRKRSSNYHFTNFDVVFEEMRAAAKSKGHTINDIFLASISVGLSKYHAAKGSSVDELNLNMPISTRSGAESGNAVSIARFELPLNVPDLDELMNSLSSTVKKMRLEPAIDYTNQIGEISRFIPKELLVMGAQASDVTASNVPGPPFTIYTAGAKVEAIVPAPPPLGAAVFIALMTYAGTAYIGMALDDKAIDDQDLFTKCMREGFEELIGKPTKDGDPFVGLSSKARAKRAAPRKVAAKKAPTRKATAKNAPTKKAPTKKVSARKAKAKPKA